MDNDNITMSIVNEVRGIKYGYTHGFYRGTLRGGPNVITLILGDEGKQSIKQLFVKNKL